MTAFLGSWLVSEYVYNPSGTFVGVVHQRRELARLENGNLRVWQFCEPCEFEHPLARREGEYVFELKVDGRARRYLGPDVLGSGLSWGEGVLTARGLWPRFGYNFTSFSVQTSAERQVTGGKFFSASEMVANIVGVAVADDGRGGQPSARTWPKMRGPLWANEVSERWRGTVRTVNAEGTVSAERVVERRYNGLGWDEGDDAEAVRLTENDDRFLFSTSQLAGIAKRVGHLLEIEAFGADGVSVEWMEVLDGVELIGLRRWKCDETIQQVEVLRLQPE
jgi:hypothetical protein